MIKRSWIWLIILVIVSACTASSSAATVNSETAEPEPTVTPVPEVPEDVELLPEEAPPAGATREFDTDFSKHIVPYDEILSGGPGRDGIPAITEPKFVSVDQADEWLAPKEPVIQVQIGDEVRAYPIRILMWHEIVNDTIGDVPVAVTFCPLCNTGIAFERRIEGQTLTFGTTGRLRFSNLIMYDRQTETWWQQATGEGIVGAHVGRQLAFVPATMVGWADFKATYPDAEVLSQQTGFARTYGSNPYGGYDDIDNSPFLYEGPSTPGQLPPMARVFTVELNGDAVAYPYDVMQDQKVVNDTVGGEPIVLFWQAGTASALDANRVAEGEDVGTVVAFKRTLGGEVVTFEVQDGEIVEPESGTTWDVFGQATSDNDGPQELEPVVGINHFWFSWAAFRPETRVYQPGGESGETPPDVDPEVTEEADVSAGAGGAYPEELDSDFLIEVYQGAETLGGSEMWFSQILARGKPVVLAFWAGQCPICRRELPEVEAAGGAFADEVLVVGVDVGPYTGLGDKDDALALIEELGLTFPMGSTPEAAVMRDYRVTGIPTLLFFTPSGEQVERFTGAVGEDRLVQAIEDLLQISR
jgi:thiol-disulfide isomerase/thioredoxin